MNVDWEFTAQTYLDQLPPHEQGRVAHALAQLSANWDETQLQKVAGPPSNQAEELYSLRVGRELRVLLRRRGDAVVVVDVVRRGQIEGLRDLWHVAPG